MTITSARAADLVTETAFGNVGVDTSARQQRASGAAKVLKPPAGNAAGHVEP
jgi:hypothetical protein